MTKLRLQMALAGVLVIAGIALTVSGGSDESGGCQAAPPELLATIGKGLTVSGGGTLSRSQLVRSRGAGRPWLLAAEIDGPGLEAPGHVGVWAMPSKTPTVAEITSVDDLARQFSRWPLRIGDNAPLAAEARACLP